MFIRDSIEVEKKGRQWIHWHPAQTAFQRKRRKTQKGTKELANGRTSTQASKLGKQGKKERVKPTKNGSNHMQTNTTLIKAPNTQTVNYTITQNLMVSHIHPRETDVFFCLSQALEEFPEKLSSHLEAVCLYAKTRRKFLAPSSHFPSWPPF